MSVTIEVGDVVQIAHTFEMGDTKAINTLYYKLTNVVDSVTGIPAAVAIDTKYVLPPLAQEMYNLMGTAWAGGSVAGVKLIHTDAQKVIGAPRSEQYRHVPNVQTTGLQLGEALPLQDSVTLLKKTGIGERWGLGRMFVVGIPEASQANGTLTAGGIANLEPLKLFLKSAVTQAEDDYTYTWRPTLFVMRDVGARVTEITHVELSDAIIKTQRRRRPGKGM